MSVFERLMQPENLNFAWLKAKNLYRSADGYVDAAEYAAFELRLEKNLLNIRRQFARGKYSLKKLKPFPRPKKHSDGRAIDRQYYHVAIEDQVAWIALVNAIGPELDRSMEPWSYGNRLYRPAWYEPDETGGSKLEIGPYRHASGHLYRRFQHSWPLFRRHVTLTARMMARRQSLNLDELDESEQLAVATARRENLIYFKKSFWQRKSTSTNGSDLYHASIDLEKFYPNLNIDAVLTGLDSGGALSESTVSDLVRSMLQFRIDMTGVPNDTLLNVEPSFLRTKFNGIPTGLYVSGFLANAAMLPVDKTVAKEIRKRRNVAHFRFVDDHAILSYDFDDLCNWVILYSDLLKLLGIGPRINVQKSDPPEFGRLIASYSGRDAIKRRDIDAVDHAKRETRLDGKDPTKLMTKTLAQVSAIATADIHIMDDDDLDDRLILLEWLLLADIPDREIRSDTRASFAAGQLASLVPVRVSEVDGVVEAHRMLAEHCNRNPDPERSTEKERTEYEVELAALEDRVTSLTAKQNHQEGLLLRRCFNLILQALREFPGKARLFFRTHDYCRRTGHKGLMEISDWISELRAANCVAWGDYYAGLSLQILAKGMPLSAAKLMSSDTMQSDLRAAERHLEDVAEMETATFVIPRDREAWFHAVGRKEFGIALLQTAECLRPNPKFKHLSDKFSEMSGYMVSLKPGSPTTKWVADTGWTAGVWAHRLEDILSNGVGPSQAWFTVSSSFSFDRELDLIAARRYPQNLPDAAWKYILNSKVTLPDDDSAWISEVIGDSSIRIQEARQSNKRAVARASRSLNPIRLDKISLSDWTRKLGEASPFDPRCSEWTALEIVRQLLEDAVSIEGSTKVLDRLHPDNVLVPRQWITEHPLQSDAATQGWEEWRECVRAAGSSPVVLRHAGSCLWDYRFASRGFSGLQISRNERRLASIGRLLLGLLRRNHRVPSIWNIRGNEQVLRLPRARWFRELAISSPTTQILEACLAARAAESRVIALQPELFAVESGKPLNDTTFDPKPILGLNDLIESTQRSQELLQANQISVSDKQPRQLIPFRLRDFAAAAEDDAPNVDAGADDDQM